MRVESCATETIIGDGGSGCVEGDNGLNIEGWM